MSASEWDDFATDWDTDTDVRDYAAKAFASWEAKVAPEIARLSDCRVLDFGCGTGLLSERLAGRCGRVIAIDSSPKMIEVLERKIERSGAGNVVASVATVDDKSIASDPLLAEKFDLVVASSVCSFLPDYEVTLRALASLLVAGGRFVQWDWVSDMPEGRIREAFDAAALVERFIGQAFCMESREGSAAVVMGVGQKAS